MGKKQKVRLSDKELHEKIDRLVSIRPIANEYTLLCRDIKAEMIARKASNVATHAGNRAVVHSSPGTSWVLVKLVKYLPETLLEMLCPRKPDAKKLNQRLAACPEDKALAACRVETPGKLELSVLAKGEELAALTQNSTEDDDQVAA